MRRCLYETHYAKSYSRERVWVNRQIDYKGKRGCVNRPIDREKRKKNFMRKIHTHIHGGIVNYQLIWEACDS